MPLTATVDPGHHHFATDVVYFYMNNGEQHVRCGVTRLSLELLEPDLPSTKQGRIQAFKQRRTRIERAASAKFDRGHFEPDGRTVLVRAVDLVQPTIDGQFRHGERTKAAIAEQRKFSALRVLRADLT